MKNPRYTRTCPYCGRTFSTDSFRRDHCYAEDCVAEHERRISHAAYLRRKAACADSRRRDGAWIMDYAGFSMDCPYAGGRLPATILFNPFA